MTDEELAMIRGRNKGVAHLAEIQPVPAVAAQVARAAIDADALLAEVERLRVENAAMREIVQAFAKDNGPLVQDREYGAYDCGCCDGVPEQWKDGTYAMERDAFIHAPDCPVTKARELLGKAGE